MRTILSRASASVAILSLLISGLLSTFPIAISDAASSPAGEFVVTAFPHDTYAVDFYDSWGAGRSGGRHHEGTDIISPRGTEIVAVADGVIAEFGQQSMSGYFIRIDHGDGWVSTYMHLNNDTLGTDDGTGGAWTAFFATVAEGATVTSGQVIGYVGDSGNAEGTTPHTHFELKFEGEKVNPYPYLKDAWDRQQPSLFTAPVAL